MATQAPKLQLIRGAVGTAALVLGVWLGGQVWPHLRLPGSEQGRVRPSTPPFVVAQGPSAAPDVKTSVLGTDASLSATPLTLVLVSTAPGHSLADSTATLGTDPKNPQTYAGGALLSNGARIVEIQADRIVLSMRGRKATLPVNARGAPSALAGTTRPADDAVSVGALGNTEARPPVEASSREDLSEFLRPQPEYENGRLAGLKILAGTNASRLTSLGLEQGDVIREVAGAAVNSERDWQGIDDVLSSGGSLVVGVERDGKRISVVLDGARLAGGQPAI